MTTISATTQPDLTSNPLSFNADDIFTFVIDSIHLGTAAKGLDVQLSARES